MDQSEKEDNIPDDALKGSSSFKCSIESTFLVPSFQLSDDCNVSVICDRVETDGDHLGLSDRLKVRYLLSYFVDEEIIIFTILLYEY